MNTCIKYHSYLKEGYGTNMDDEDWNTDLPLCSSTKMNQLLNSDIPVKQHKSHFFSEEFCAVHQKVTTATRWIGYPCLHKKAQRKQSESQTIMGKNIWLNLSESQTITGKNSGMASFLPGTLY